MGFNGKATMAAVIIWRRHYMAWSWQTYQRS